MRLIVTGILLALGACSGNISGSGADGATSAGGAAPVVLACAVPGQISCGGMCIDGRADPRNCGACGADCGAVACTQGVCAPPSAACNPACAVGQQCVAGLCQCPAGQLFCAGVCLDPLTTPEHCGSCETMCEPAQLCQAGKCVCAAGQTQCSSGCVDLQTSNSDCASCGNACATGEVCMAGKCHAPLGADGCGGAARDVTLSEVAAYQSIKIPLNKGVTPIATASRLVDVVQGRKTLFRVAVTVATGFVPRELSARVQVTHGTSSMQYFAKQRVTKSSTDSDTSSTFQVEVPAEQITADTHYAVELVECSETTTGMLQAARFPTEGDLPLDARKTGILKIKLIPLRANARLPDTSDTALKVYKDFMEAMYPIEQVQLSVGAPQNVAYPVNWNTTIDQLRQLRQSDRPEDDIYYYGMLAPAATLKAYCQRGCTAGVGYVAELGEAQTQVAMGLAFGDETSGAVMAHEVGHNHGRAHAPCAPGNQISGVDRMYPDPQALTKVWGYDSRKQTFFDGDKTKDIMGYCDPKWISAYTYAGMLERVADLNTAPLIVSALATQPSAAEYSVLLVDAEGPRWGQPFERAEAPFGLSEDADALDIDGQVVERITVYRTVLGDHDGATLLVPPAKRGWNAVRTADGATLSFAAPIAVSRMQSD